MVEMYHHQALWDVRQHPAIHELFGDLFGGDDLWVFIDRANLKPPPNVQYPEYDHQGMVHWDIDVRQAPTPFQVQGVLYLVKTRQGEGGFQCVPAVHARAAEISAGISNEDQRHQLLHERFPHQIGPPIEIEADAGDFIVWHSALLHGNSRNCSDKPRLAQYVRMFPADPADEELREARIASWREKHAPRVPEHASIPR
jgi:ectoine hydroxylase-related dioxygenase (phytanoyl-CoA dioxygenase family)